MAELDTEQPEVPPPPQVAIGPSAGMALANPPAASPAPAPDPAAEARAGAWNAQARRMEALTAREETLFEERQKALAPMYDEARAASRGLARTSEQATHELLASQQEIAPYRAPDFRQSMGEWMMMAAAFGAIGNAFSRGNATNALTAFSGILNGANKGSLEAINQNYQTWEANAKQAEAYNRQALVRYKAVMDNAQLNWDQKSAQIKMTADQYQDAIMSSAAEQKNITAMMEIYDKQDRFAEGMATRRGAIEEHKREFEVRQKQRDEVLFGSTDDVDAAKQNILSMNSPFPSPTQQARSPYLRQAAAAVMKENPNYNASDYYVNLQNKKLAGSADITALRGALTKAVANQASIDRFEPIAKYNGDIIMRLIDKVDATGSTTFNKWVNAGRKATGDPDVAQFDQAMTAYSNEVSRILNQPGLTGTLTVSAQQEVKEWLPVSMTASQVRRIVPSLNAEMDYRKQVTGAQVEYLQGSIDNLAKGGPRPAPFQAPAPLAPPPIGQETTPTTTDDLEVLQ
jgi:hypothetical protein